jgi:very-short-patch-repair endonuclease
LLTSSRWRGEVGRHSTNVELRLWNRLRSRSICGCNFVRQEPIDPYTVDFVCRDYRLVVEVDGGQHADSSDDIVRDPGSFRGITACSDFGTMM